MNQSRWAPPQSSEEQENASNSAIVSPPSSSIPEVAESTAAATSAPEPSSAETFVQTGGDTDDLFDNVTPIDGAVRVRAEDELFSDDFTPAENPIIEPLPAPVSYRGRPTGRRTGGRSRGRGTDTPRQTSKPSRNNRQDSEAPKESEVIPPAGAPAGPRKETTAAVRGDRRATGGVRKPKLSEEELAEKLAQIQIKNASLTAAYARAEADAASFAEREQRAKELVTLRQKEERRDRQQMMGEREKNRMRKLKAMEGREWDAEKKEEDFRGNPRHERRGNNTSDSQEYTDGREYLYREPKGANKGRNTDTRASKGEGQTAPVPQDFPALPSTGKAQEANGASGHQDTKATPTTSGKSWADQVESSSVPVNTA